MIRTLAPGPIRLVTTEKQTKLRACDVRRKTGADVVINGSLFDFSTWRPLCYVKCQGKVLANDGFLYRGLGWNGGDDRFTVATTAEAGRFENFLACLFLVHERKALPLRPAPGMAGYSARTALFGTGSGRTHIWCSREKLTPWQLQKRLLDRGDVVWAMLLDGGGSTQLSQRGRSYIYSARRVQNYLCFWENPQEREPEGGIPMVEINGYSMKKDENRKLSAHFRVGEFACRDGADTVLVAPRLVMVLETLRSRFGKAVRIHSGYRTPEYNRSPQVGGSPHSQHTYGTAADISISGVSPEKVARCARELMPDWGGVGVYQGFTHIDVREEKADWKG